MAQGRHYVCRSVEEDTTSMVAEGEEGATAATLIPPIPPARLSTFGIGPWQASNPSTMVDVPLTPSPVSSRTPTSISAALPQSQLSEFQMPGDDEITKGYNIGYSEDANGGSRHHFAVQQPTRGGEGEDQDPLPGRPRAQPGMLRRLAGWLKKAASRVRRWGC